MKHNFTTTIKEVLEKYFGENSEQIFKNSDLIQFLNLETQSANAGSKKRSNFGTIYTIFTLVEDYINNGFFEKDGYSKYDGARFTDLKKRANELDFGSKLQNHSFNHRVNEKYKRSIPLSGIIPVLRDGATKRYWVNENLLIVGNNI